MDPLRWFLVVDIASRTVDIVTPDALEEADLADDCRKIAAQNWGHSDWRQIKVVELNLEQVTTLELGIHF